MSGYWIPWRHWLVIRQQQDHSFILTTFDCHTSPRFLSLAIFIRALESLTRKKRSAARKMVAKTVNVEIWCWDVILASSLTAVVMVIESR